MDAAPSISKKQREHILTNIRHALEGLHEENVGHPKVKTHGKNGVGFLMPWEYHDLSAEEEIEIDGLFMALLAMVILMVFWIYSCFMKRFKFISVKTGPIDPLKNLPGDEDEYAGAEGLISERRHGYGQIGKAPFPRQRGHGRKQNIIEV